MKTNILQELKLATEERIKKQKEEISFGEMRDRALEMSDDHTRDFIFERTLKGEGMHFICEVKKASPSKGLIAENFPYKDIAKEYEAAGADCMSILTEPTRFLGSDEYLREIREVVDIPLLRKDFTVDPYMIYQAKVLGADAVLLICSLLENETLIEYLNICDTIGLTALVEAHDENEVAMAAGAGARVIGVNNRNLKDFTVDIKNSMRLKKYAPKECIFVAESGIKTHEDIAELVAGDVNAVLIGETLMRSDDKKRMLDELKGENLKL
ncbi:MAG: indole-3-glycerol phosphate synthase TrpC [Lachnospiraceae bacterium]|nr:indole-3-glycerol phosphate synthase TrpC [Lachnospiraceae bacterium]